MSVSRLLQRSVSQEMKEEKQVRLSISSDRSRRDSQIDGEDSSALRGLRKNSDDTLETLPDGTKRRKSSIKPVRLSLQTLSEHQSEMVAQSQQHHLQRQRRRTVTETSQTDISTDSGSRERAMSLYRSHNAALSLRAMRVTRRLSIASFNKSLLDTNTRPTPGDTQYENTYKMEAGDTQRFRPGDARKVMEQMMELNLRDMKYSAHEAPKLCCSLASAIKTCLRQRQEMPRYKLVCHVTIGQKQGQDMRVASRCLWDKEHDNSACATYDSHALFAVAVVYAVYFE